MSDWINIYAIDINLAVECDPEDQNRIESMVREFIVDVRQRFPRNRIDWAAGAGTVPSNEFPEAIEDIYD